MPGRAQTWHWPFTAHRPNAGPVATHSTVVLSSSEVQLSYATSIDGRDAVIASCRASIGDIETAKAVHSNQGWFLLVRLKPQRTAGCDSGRAPVVILPADEPRLAASAATAIDRACCTAVAAVPKRRPVAPPSKAPAASPSPAASREPLQVVNWVESDGLFAYVRVANRGTAPVTIGDVEIRDCKNVDYGCSRTGPRSIVDAGATQTIATIASNARGQAGAFTYRYNATSGGVTISREGSSTEPSIVGQRMTPDERRVAQSAVIAALRMPAAADVSQRRPADTAARLLQRGSSRLAIGQTGVAQLRVTVSATGAPENVEIVSLSNRRLAAAAIETAVSSTYAPATQHGRPVSGKYVATFNFDGEDPANASVPSWKRPLPSSFSATSPSLPVASALPVSTPSPAPPPAPSPTPSRQPS